MGVPVPLLLDGAAVSRPVIRETHYYTKKPLQSQRLSTIARDLRGLDPRPATVDNLPSRAAEAVQSGRSKESFPQHER
jgi:hypothetical protein